MSKFIILYQYYVKDTSQGQVPQFDVKRIIDTNGEIYIEPQLLKIFESEEEMQELFIEWAKENKVVELNFIALNEFNHLLHNCHSVQDFSKNYSQYCQIWKTQEKTKDSLFKGLFKQ